MKRILTLLLIVVSSYSFGQKHSSFGPLEKAQKRIEELERIKLLEVLDLKEDVMLKFFSRRKESSEKFRNLDRLKNEKVNELEKAIGRESDQSLKKRIDEINSLDESMNKNRTEYIRSLSDILTQEQIAKVVVFERNFRKELRDLIVKHRKSRP